MKPDAVLAALQLSVALMFLGAQGGACRVCQTAGMPRQGRPALAMRRRASPTLARWGASRRRRRRRRGRAARQHARATPVRAPRDLSRVFVRLASDLASELLPGRLMSPSVAAPCVHSISGALADSPSAHVVPRAATPCCGPHSLTSLHVKATLMFA